MIIACPECSHPFEVLDGQIAPLVQLACPNCEFAMILDFAAANDPSLVEAGMKMASGFRSAVDYRTAVAGPSARPHLEVAAPDDLSEPAEAETPEAEAPEAETPEIEAEVEPAAKAVERAAETSPEEAFDDGPTMISAPNRLPSPDPSPDRGPADAQPQPAPENKPARGDTHIGLPPSAPRSETVIGPPPTAPPTAMSIAPDDSMEADDEVTQIRTLQPVDEVRKAPHTPPSTSQPSAKDSRDEDEGGKRVEITRKPARERPSAEDEAPTRKAVRKSPQFESHLPEETTPSAGMFGTVVVALLALLAVGLVGASVMQEDTPDPRPLLEKLYRQYMK